MSWIGKCIVQEVKQGYSLMSQYLTFFLQLYAAQIAQRKWKGSGSPSLSKPEISAIAIERERTCCLTTDN
jgi:hypothetical protein